MLSKFNLVCLAIALSLFVVSCASDADSDVRETARQSIAPNTPDATAAVPATPQAAQPAAPVGPTTTMTFEETSFDFGTVVDGEKVRHVYNFTNTGAEPLIISNARGSCGCTVPQWPQEPIAPGDKGEIVVEFDSKGKPGRQTKTVTITANTNPTTSKLTITGEVDAANAADVKVVQ